MSEYVCASCQRRPGTMVFWWNMICEHCVVAVQLANARAAAEKIPELEQKLRELEAAEKHT